MTATNARRPIIIYRETMLAASEPFITAQAESLRRHVPHYLSIRRVDAHPLPAERDLRWSSGGSLRRYAWKRHGISRKAHRALARVAPVLVHAHFGRDAVQVLPLARRTRLPLVVTFHGHDATRTDANLASGSYSDRLFLRRRDELAAEAALVLAVSEFVANRLHGLGFDPRRLAVHHIGVDTRAIAEHACRGRQLALSGARDDRPIVLYAGRLVAHKGVEDLLEALTEVDDRRELRLVVIGDGPLRAALERRAVEASIDAVFLGFQAPHQVWSWMGRAAVTVVPSRTGPDGWMEAFGLVAAEAQAAGSRVIASTCGGLPEAVAPANRDLMFPEGDREALADRLDVVLAGGDGDARLAAAAWVARERDLHRQTAVLDDLYEQVSR